MSRFLFALATVSFGLGLATGASAEQTDFCRPGSSLRCAPKTTICVGTEFGRLSRSDVERRIGRWLYAISEDSEDEFQPSASMAFSAALTRMKPRLGYVAIFFDGKHVTFLRLAAGGRVRGICRIYDPHPDFGA